MTDNRPTAQVRGPKLAKSGTARASGPAPHSVPIQRLPVVRSPATGSIRRRHQFETSDKAVERNESRVGVLQKSALGIARAIGQCNDDKPCRLPICAVCAREYRIVFSSQLGRIAEAFAGPHQFVTVHLETIDPGGLEQVIIRRSHDALRKRFVRHGLGGSILAGGTEVTWLADANVWIFHVHLLAISSPPRAWDRLRKDLVAAGVKRPVVVQRLRDPARQLSYAQKFITLHRPPKRSGRGVPLTKARLAELAKWMAEYRFEDFAFLYGARRRGRFIVAHKSPQRPARSSAREGERR
jgi:hypothetical protein